MKPEEKARQKIDELLTYAEVERRLSVVAATEQAIVAIFSRAQHLRRQSILHCAFTGRLI